MRDDDFDRRRARQDHAHDPAIDRARQPGRQTLVEAESGAHDAAPSTPGKRTLVDALSRSTQGIAQSPDPVTETEFEVRKAREIMEKLAADVAPTEQRVLRADLRCHLENAKSAGARAFASPGGRTVAESMLTLVAEAEALLARQGRDAEHPGSDPVAVAQRGVAGPGQSLPHLDEVQRLLGVNDLSGIRAHIGGPAATASRELGAHAYAQGNNIAFAEHPDAPMVAHEVTHVLQQRAGVSMKGIDGGSSDAHEQQAEAVESRVARGLSAADLLSTFGSGSGAGSAHAVQRKSGAAAISATATHDEGPPTVKAPHAKWPVFSESGLPYKIESTQPPVRFWTVSDWIRAGAGFQAHGNHARSPACAAEIIRALGWVEEKHVAFAAKNIVFDISRRVMPIEVSASAFYFLGMPTSAPVVSRAGGDTLYVATRLDDPNVPPGTPVEADDAQRLRVIRALSDFTGLAPEPRALENLRNDERLREFVVQSGVLLWKIDREAGNEIFGYDETSDDSGPFTRWLHAKQDKQKPKSGPDTQKLKLQDFYGEPIPGELNVDRDLVEAGHPMWLGIDVSWPKNYPSAAEYDVVPMVTPGHGGRNISLLKCDWHIELVGGNSAPPKTAAPAESATAGGASAATSSASGASSSVATTPSGANVPASSASAAPDASPVSAASTGVTAHTDVGELHHVFVLPPGQEQGTFRVNVRASFDEYFEPRDFAKTVEVKSTAAAMKQLGDEAFDLGSRETSRTKETFDSSGSGDDNHGYRTTGDLPASFKPSTVDGPDPRAASREEQRKRLEATRVYLEANGAQKDVLAAVDRELEQSRATEAALASDRSKGWQPFQIRGTYLSREDGVPSGTLTLYGSVHSEPVLNFSVAMIVVQIRDLSRRFDNEDMTFTGQGTTFDAALKSAFTGNAKAYPKGVMEIEAEAIDAYVEAGQATIGKSTGKTIGFQLGTDSRWKRVKADVWDPAVNIVTNLGAMAIMAFVPGSAVVVAPLLVAYNSIPAADRLRTESERGTLTLGTAATSVGEIALNLLPLAGEAKAFTGKWFLIEGANWGGQAVLMTAEAVQTARQLQSTDVEALASMYEELQKLEAQPGTDPAVLARKRADIMKRAKEVSHRIEDVITEQIAQNAMMAVAGSVIHNAGTEHQAADIIDGYLKDRGASAGDESSTHQTEDHGTAASTATPADATEHPTTASTTHDSEAGGAAPSKRTTTANNEKQANNERQLATSAPAAKHKADSTLAGNEHSPRDKEMTAASVPGSAFKGRDRSHADAAAIVERANAEIAAAVQRFNGSVTKAVATEHHTNASERALIEATYLVTMPDGEAFTIRLTSGAIGSDAVARTIVNRTKQGQTFVQDPHGGKPRAVQIEGRYVIQLNDTIDAGNVDRALTHEVAEILAERQLAADKQHAGPDMLKPGAEPAKGATLSPHDRGRLAEVKLLADKLAKNQKDTSAQRELLALVEDLGLREGTSGAAERRRVAFVELHDEGTVKIVEEVSRADANLDPETKTQLESVKQARDADLAAADTKQAARAPIHELPDAKPEAGKPVSLERAEELAGEAKRERAKRSKATVADLRAKAKSLPHGEYPKYGNLQIGGGAALAAREPGALFVDAAGRWQEDASKYIAQTASQLRGLKEAGLGDPYQFAQPDERVPLAAVHYWEDSIAAQGPVIDGKVTSIAIDDAGRTIVTIQPKDGGEAIKVQITGDLTLATGFPVERIPGTPSRMDPEKGIAGVKDALRKIASDAHDPARQAKAQAALDRIEHLVGLESAPGQREKDLAEVRKAVRDNGLEADISATNKDSYDMVVAGDKWEHLRREHPDKFVLGDDANLKALDAAKTNKWIVGGSSGSGISAAEIILERNTAAHVTMVGDKPPPGLLENDQFRKVVEQHGDAQTVALYKKLGGVELKPGDGRFSLVLDVRVDTPNISANGSIEVHGTHTEGAQKGQRVAGDFVPDGYTARDNPLADAGAYVTSIGRSDQLPPVAAELKASVEKSGGKVVMALLWDGEGQYAGYRLSARDKSGSVIRTLDVTGAASRFPPWELQDPKVSVEVRERERARFWEAADIDAPPESGNFDGGFVASAEQAKRYAHLRARERKGAP